MPPLGRRQHWTRIYETKQERDVSWFEPTPDISLQMIDAAGLVRKSCVIDIGGGESHLVDVLLERGLTCVAVLDMAQPALQRARARLGSAADIVTWINADVTGEWSWNPVDVWHDRAAFHFLTEPQDRDRYKDKLSTLLKPDGSAIIATFAPDGPEKCSGLPVVRYSPESLAAELGSAFTLKESRRHVHTTPWGKTQSFQYSRFTRRQDRRQPAPARAPQEKGK